MLPWCTAREGREELAVSSLLSCTTQRFVRGRVEGRGGEEREEGRKKERVEERRVYILYGHTHTHTHYTQRCSST